MENVSDIRRANEIFACIGGYILNGKRFDAKNVVKVVVRCGNGYTTMLLNAGGLLEALFLNCVESYTTLSEDEINTLLSQIKKVCCRNLNAHQVLDIANLVCKLVPARFRDDVFSAMATAMENSGVAKIVPGEVNLSDAKVMCGEYFRLFKTDKWVLIKKKLSSDGIDEKQLEKLSAAAEQSSDWLMALELLSADFSEEEETLWTGKEFDAEFCTIIAKYSPVFAKFVDLGINWTKRE